MIGDLHDLFIHLPGALDTLWLVHARCQHQHISLTEKLFSTHLIKNRAAVYLRGNRKGDTSRNVSLNKTRDDINRRTLSGKY
ncbi:hypothetical protein D3C72_1160610 [compost metagenome]